MLPTMRADAVRYSNCGVPESPAEVARQQPARKWLLMADELGNSEGKQLTPEFPAKMLGSHQSTATLAPVSEKRSRPFRLRTPTVIALMVVSNVLGNFTLSRGLHEVGRLVSFSPWPYIHAFLNPLVGG